MTEKTKMIIHMIAAQDGVSPEYVEEKMKEAIRTAMASTDPRAQALWRQIAPEGKEPDLDTFLEFTASKVNSMMNERPPKTGRQNIS